MTSGDLYALLGALGIPYAAHEHAPVFTCDEAFAAIEDPESVQTKNLFLRDKRGRRHILVIAACTTPVDTARVTREIHADRLSFGSAERLQTCLGVTPGAVTLFGLANDPEHAVELVVDDQLWRQPTWRCHPLVNDATVVIRRDGVEAFLTHTGHVPRIINVRDADGPGTYIS